MFIVYVHLSYVLQVVLVTDGSLGIGKGSLRHALQTVKLRGDDKKFPLPFPFPTKLYIMCVANADEVLCYNLWTVHFDVKSFGWMVKHVRVQLQFKLYLCDELAIVSIKSRRKFI